jgi:hypothetical protein
VKHRIPLENLGKFIEALDDSIALFDWGSLVHEISRPAAVRQNLNRARDAAKALSDALLNLDGNSCQLIGYAQESGIFSLRANATDTISALDSAIRLANQYPQSGRLPEPRRIYLAADVADAMETHLGVEPNSTKNGAFIEVLETVLEVATSAGEIKAIHELARRALSSDVKIKHADGTVTYIPPNRN